MIATIDEARQALRLADEFLRERNQRIAELEAALRSAPDQPVGLLADDEEFKQRVLEWHHRYTTWLFEMPPVGRT